MKVQEEDMKVEQEFVFVWSFNKVSGSKVNFDKDYSIKAIASCIPTFVFCIPLNM